MGSRFLASQTGGNKAFWSEIISSVLELARQVVTHHRSVNHALHDHRELIAVLPVDDGVEDGARRQPYSRPATTAAGDVVEVGDLAMMEHRPLLWIAKGCGVLNQCFRLT